MDEKETVGNEDDADKESDEVKAVTTPSKEDTAVEDDKDTEMADETPVETPKPTRGRPPKSRSRKKKVPESPYSLKAETRRERKVANHFDPGNHIEERKKNSDFPAMVG